VFAIIVAVSVAGTDDEEHYIPQRARPDSFYDDLGVTKRERQ